MSTKINGSLSVPGELNFKYDGDNPLDLNGYITTQEELVSTYNDDEPLEIIGHLSIPEYVGELYDGPYEVTPTEATQTLQAEGLMMTQDVKVKPIPNNYGLITWNGSVLTVS